MLKMIAAKAPLDLATHIFAYPATHPAVIPSKPFVAVRHEQAAAGLSLAVEHHHLVRAVARSGHRVDRHRGLDARDFVGRELDVERA
jgi:hypothetical protein